MIASLVALTGSIFIPFFAENLITLEVGEILCGIPWGIFQTLTTAYASEVCPTQLRAYLTTYVNLCWVFGQLIGSGVLRAHALGTDKWSYKIPFGKFSLLPIIDAYKLINGSHPVDLARSNLSRCSFRARITMVARPPRQG